MYLNSEKVAFAFFDGNLEKTIKRSIIAKLTLNDKTDDNCDNKDFKARVSLQEVDNLLNKKIDFFFPQTLNFFMRFEIDINFLNADPIYGVKIYIT